jgi:hypothetical protein
MSDKYIKIDRTGRTMVLGQELRRTLSHHAGYYQLSGIKNNEIKFSKLEEIPRHGELKEPIIFQGDIGGIGSTIEIINFICSAKMTGQLIFVQGQVRKSLFFNKGDLCSARSNHIQDALSEILNRYGALDKNQINQAQARSELVQKPLGNYLIEQGLINQNQLFLYFKKQVEEIFYSVLLFVQGDFYFTLTHLEEFPTPLSISTQQILLEGVRRTDDMRRFRMDIPSNQSMVYIRSNVSANLNPELQSILDELSSQPLTVQALIDLFRVGEYRLLQRLFSLLEGGFIQIQNVEEKSIKKIGVADLITFYNDTFAIIQDYANQAGQPESLEKGLEIFLQFYGFNQLFRGLSFDRKGKLDQVKFIKQLEELQRKDPFFFVAQALSELLYFEIFTARPWLSDEQTSKLNEISDQLSQLSMS